MRGTSAPAPSTSPRPDSNPAVAGDPNSGSGRWRRRRGLSAHSCDHRPRAAAQAGQSTVLAAGCGGRSRGERVGGDRFGWTGGKQAPAHVPGLTRGGPLRAAHGHQRHGPTAHGYGGGSLVYGRRSGCRHARSFTGRPRPGHRVAPVRPALAGGRQGRTPGHARRGPIGQRPQCGNAGRINGRPGRPGLAPGPSGDRLLQRAYQRHPLPGRWPRRPRRRWS